MTKIATLFPYDEVSYSLSSNQVDKLNEWREGVHLRAAALQESQGLREKYAKIGASLPYYGTIGGAYTFSFVDTGMGTVCKVRENITGEEIDLSDYDEW
jgi:hypothetical protein